jgi:hypothetical protein
MSFKIEIELPDWCEFVRAGQEMQLPVTHLPPAILAELVLHGIAQKVGDAAAGKDEEEGLAKMGAVWDALCQGAWGTRRAAAPRATRAIGHRRDVLQAWWKKWTGVPFKRVKGESDNDRLDAQWSELSEAWQARVEDEVQRRIADEDELDVTVDMGDEAPAAPAE